MVYVSHFSNFGAFEHEQIDNLSSFVLTGMQFSFVPWLYDQEVIDHTKAMIALRESYANKIVDLARASTETGEPINRPIWWLDPYDETAFEIGDGETI